jgi:KaiC/GvpD/RAD55 family RecA-like ATPase
MYMTTPVNPLTMAVKNAFTSVPIHDIEHASIKPPEMVLGSLIPRDVLTIVSGHGGCGKSTLGLTFCAHVAAGKDFAGMSTATGRAVFVSMEDSAAIVRFRLRRIIESFGLNARDVIENLLILDCSGTDAPLASECSEAGVRRVEKTEAFVDLSEAVTGRDLIVIDNSSDAFDADENSRRQVRSFLRMLTEIAVRQSAAVVLLTHIDKASLRHGSPDNSPSGSTAWHNSARSRLALIADGDLVRLSHEKFNYGPRADVLTLMWGDDGTLIPVSPSSRNDVTERDSVGILSAMAAAESAGVMVFESRGGAANTHAILRGFSELPPKLVRDRNAFWSSLTHLIRSKRVIVRDYRTPDRKIKRIIVAAA